LKLGLIVSKVFDLVVFSQTDGLEHSRMVFLLSLHKLRSFDQVW